MAVISAIHSRPVIAQSQTFRSGSTGLDGPLTYTTPGPNGNTIIFDPATIKNHHAGDTIFNFTTITIGPNVKVRLDSTNLPGPVYWLATGDVNITGTLDLSGSIGHPTGDRVKRYYSVPGAGGFAGGLAAVRLWLPRQVADRAAVQPEQPPIRTEREAPFREANI
jgi:hypothetical protein